MRFKEIKKYIGKKLYFPVDVSWLDAEHDCIMLCDAEGNDVWEIFENSKEDIPVIPPTPDWRYNELNREKKEVEEKLRQISQEMNAIIEDNS